MSTEHSADAPLFRREALLHAGLQEHGAVLLAHPVPLRVLAALLVAAVAAVAGVLASLGTARAGHAHPSTAVTGSRASPGVASEGPLRLDRPNDVQHRTAGYR